MSIGRALKRLVKPTRKVESRSGTGSSLEQTRVIRGELPRLLASYRVRKLLDLPCGDFHWMGSVDLSGMDYLGGDIDAEIIDDIRRRFARPRVSFARIDILNEVPPKADLVLCRDCLVHFSFHDIRRALDNLGRSGATYLLTTTFTRDEENTDISTGDWRPLNLTLAPFAFPPSLTLINEGCTEGKGRWADKSLGLWRLADL